MGRFQVVLIDLSGTLHVDTLPVRRSVEGLQKLRLLAKQHQLAVRFVSNTTKESKFDLVKKLNKIGFLSIDSRAVFTPIETCRSILKHSHAVRPLCFLSDSTLNELNMSENEERGGYDSIVVGLDPASFHYHKLNQAFRLLHANPNAPVIALHRGRYFKDDDGKNSLGPGPFVKLLEEAVAGKKVDVIVVGKPSAAFYSSAVRDCEPELNATIQASHVVMVGDDVRDDVLGAEQLGFKGVLVRTGKFAENDDKLCQTTVEDFYEFVSWLEKQLGQSASL